MLCRAPRIKPDFSTAKNASIVEGQDNKGIREGRPDKLYSEAIRKRQHQVGHMRPQYVFETGKDGPPVTYVPVGGQNMKTADNQHCIGDDNGTERIIYDYPHGAHQTGDKGDKYLKLNGGRKDKQKMDTRVSGNNI